MSPLHDWSNPASGSGGGGSTLIYSIVLPADAATIDTGAIIPSTFNELELVLVGRCTTSGNNDNIRVRLNGDAGSNYTRAYLQGSNTSVVAGNDSSVAATVIDLPGTGVTAGFVSGVRIWLPNYKDPTFFKVLHGIMGQNGGSASMFIQDMRTCTWKSTAVVNQITLSVESGTNFVAGTSMRLYGRL